MAESLFEEESTPLSSSPEGNEALGEQKEVLFAAGVNETSRWQAIARDPKIQEAAMAGVRTIINTGISVADAFPIVGEIPSWAADAGKITDKWARVLGFSTDLTPDVSKAVAIGSEALEAYSGTAAPSHAIETTMQLQKDWPRITEGFGRLHQIWSEEAGDYQENQTEIDGAIAEFDII